MREFLEAIPAAAASPYALVAYAIGALLFLLAGSRLRTTQALIARIDAIPLGDRRRFVEIATGTVLPASISPEQWMRNNRARWQFLLLASVLIVVMVISTIALVSPAGGDVSVLRRDIKDARFASLRLSYPLEPLELEFTIDYPMDQPALADYTERVRGQIVQYLRTAREGRGQTSENLADEKVMFVISNQPEWQPTDSERKARELLEDNTQFGFRTVGTSGDTGITFFSTSPTIAEAIVSKKVYGKIAQTVQLSADFSRRVFVKAVLCRYPVRTDTDSTSVSSLDLVGRELSWMQGVESDLKWVLVRFAMRFSYDSGFGQNAGELPQSRGLAVAGKQAALVTADHVGLAGVLPPS